MSDGISVLLRACVIFLFLGQAWLHLFWETPYEDFVLQGEVVRGIVEAQDGDWAEVSRSEGLVKFLSVYPTVVGLIFLVLGCMTIIWKPDWLTMGLIFLALLPLTVLFVTMALASDARLATISLNAIPLLAPLVLLLAVGARDAVTSRLICRIGIMATFLCMALLCLGPKAAPGLYGYQLEIEQPREWLQALQLILPQLDASQHALFLRILGLLILGSVIGIWVRGFVRSSAVFLAMTGLIAAGALTWFHMNPGTVTDSLHRWLPETIWRLPFFLMPFVFMRLVGMRNEDLKLQGRRKVKRARKLKPVISPADNASSGPVDSRPTRSPGPDPAPPTPVRKLNPVARNPAVNPIQPATSPQPED